MPEVIIAIGGRNFEVACNEGEQPFLEAAAKLLDGEAQVLGQQIGRMPEQRMLLMAGLMLADKTAGLQDQVAILSDKLASHEALIEELRAQDAAPADPTSAEDVLRIGALVEQAEALAQTAADETAG